MICLNAPKILAISGLSSIQLEPLILGKAYTHMLIYAEGNIGREMMWKCFSFRSIFSFVFHFFAKKRHIFGTIIESCDVFLYISKSTFCLFCSNAFIHTGRFPFSLQHELRTVNIWHSVQYVRVRKILSTIEWRLN